MPVIRVSQIGLSALSPTPPTLGNPLAAPETTRYLFHNWVSSSELECAFSTDIVASHATVSEDRRGLLDKPTRTQSCLLTQMNRNEATYAFYAISRAASERTLVPVYSSMTFLSASVSGALIPCDTRWRRFHPGGQVLIVNPDTNVTESGEILSMTNTSLTLTASISGTFNHTKCRVYPLFDAEVMLSGDLNALTDAHNEIAVEFREIPGDSALPPLSIWAPPLQIVSGLPVFRTDPDWAHAVTVQVVQSGQLLSVGKGTVPVTRGVRPKYGFSFALTGLSRSETWDLIQFFDAMQGRLRPFWLVNPLVLFDKTTADVTASRVDVFRFTTDTEGEVDIAEFSDYIAIEKTDGTIYIRGISTVVATTSGGNPVYRITFDVVLPGAIAAADIKRITTVHQVRFASDSLRERWITDEVCRLDFECLEVLEEVTASITNLVDTPTISDFEDAGSLGGPFAWIVASKLVYTGAPLVLAVPGSPNGDGNAVYAIYDAREIVPASGTPVTSRPYLQFVTSVTNIKLHKIADFTIGRGRLCAHFKTGNTDELKLIAVSSINNTWFDNSLGVTMFVVVTDLQGTEKLFYQEDVFEWDATICKPYDTFGVDESTKWIDYTDQTVRSNEIAIFAMRWTPNTQTRVWKNGVVLGTAAAQTASLPTGGGNIVMTGNNAKMFDFLLYKEALSNADMNLVGGLLATIFNTAWTTVA